MSSYKEFQEHQQKTTIEWETKQRDNMKNKTWSEIQSGCIQYYLNNGECALLQSMEDITHWMPLPNPPPTNKDSTIPKEQWGVHKRHCCLKHGCKYGDKDCPVELGLIRQEHPCEECHQYDYE